MPSPPAPTPANGEPRAADPTDQEVWFGENLRRLREGRGDSQTRLAREMANRGFPFHQTTISRIEAGERPVRLAEAITLAEIIDADLNQLTRRPDTAEALRELSTAVAGAAEAISAARRAAHHVSASRTQLEHALKAAHRLGLGKEHGQVVEQAEAAERAFREFQENAHRDWRAQVQFVRDLYELSMSPDEIAEFIGETTQDVERMIREAEGGPPELERVQLHPKTFREVLTVDDLLRRGNVVEIDFRAMPASEAPGAHHYVAGLVVGLGGSVAHSGDHSFLLIPRDISVDDALKAPVHELKES